jgi:hypothetical protein
VEDRVFGPIYAPLWVHIVYIYPYICPPWVTTMSIKKKNQFLACFKDFQPHIEGKYGLSWENVFFKTLIYTPFSSTSLLSNHEVFFRFLMIPSQALGSDIIHESQGDHFLKYVDQPYEMQGLHHKNLGWSKGEPSLSYCNPIQLSNNNQSLNLKFSNPTLCFPFHRASPMSQLLDGSHARGLLLPQRFNSLLFSDKTIQLPW